VSCGDSCDRRALVVSSPRFIDDMVAILYYMGEGTLQQCVINSFGNGNRLLYSSQRYHFLLILRGMVRARLLVTSAVG
jgi:hypothetical protein